MDDVTCARIEFVESFLVFFPRFSLGHFKSALALANLNTIEYSAFLVDDQYLFYFNRQRVKERGKKDGKTINKYYLLVLQ